MLAERMATILPPLTLQESLETTRIYSSVGLLEKNTALIATRPVRAPHHTASGPALIGGGTNPRPGELSLAHHGILFLDEFAEFPRHILEMIRQPLEDGATVSAPKGTTFPAQFILIAAMNPCPCGYFGSGQRKCKCTPRMIENYIAKVSGPLMDRIDIHIDVPPVAFRKLRSRGDQTRSAQIREQIIRVREIQTRRFGDGPVMTNARMSHKQVEAHCRLDESGEQLLKQAMAEFALSARAHDKICKVARPSPTSKTPQTSGPAHRRGHKLQETRPKTLIDWRRYKMNTIQTADSSDNRFPAPISETGHIGRWRAIAGAASARP